MISKTDMLFVRRQIKGGEAPGGPQYFIQGNTRTLRELSQISTDWDVRVVSPGGSYDSGLKLVTLERGSVGKDRLHNQRGKYDTIDKQVINKFGLAIRPEDLWKLFFRIGAIDKAVTRITIRPLQVELLDGTTLKLWKGPKPITVTIEPDLEALACDVDEPPAKALVTVSRIIRDSPKSKQLKRHYDYMCQVCRRTLLLANKLRYAETHHLKPLGGVHRGIDAWANMVVLCPNHHAMFDRGALALLAEKTHIIVLDGSSRTFKHLGRLFLQPPHNLDLKFLTYHLDSIYQGPRPILL